MKINFKDNPYYKLTDLGRDRRGFRISRYLKNALSQHGSSSDIRASHNERLAGMVETDEMNDVNESHAESPISSTEELDRIVAERAEAENVRIVEERDNRLRVERASAHNGLMRLEGNVVRITSFADKEARELFGMRDVRVEIDPETLRSGQVAGWYASAGTPQGMMYEATRNIIRGKAFLGSGDNPIELDVIFTQDHVTHDEPDSHKRISQNTLTPNPVKQRERSRPTPYPTPKLEPGDLNSDHAALNRIDAQERIKASEEGNPMPRLSETEPPRDQCVAEFYMNGEPVRSPEDIHRIINVKG